MRDGTIPRKEGKRNINEKNTENIRAESGGEGRQRRISSMICLSISFRNTFSSE
jgi:hypothetical protein